MEFGNWSVFFPTMVTVYLPGVELEGVILVILSLKLKVLRHSRREWAERVWAEASATPGQAAWTPSWVSPVATDTTGRDSDRGQARSTAGLPEFRDDVRPSLLQQILTTISGHCLSSGADTKAKAYNTCIVPRAAYRSCSSAIHVTHRSGVQPIGRRLSLHPQTDLQPTSHTQPWSAV